MTFKAKNFQMLKIMETDFCSIKGNKIRNSIVYPYLPKYNLKINSFADIIQTQIEESRLNETKQINNVIYEDDESIKYLSFNNE